VKTPLTQEFLFTAISENVARVVTIGTLFDSRMTQGHAHPPSPPDCGGDATAKSNRSGGLGDESGVSASTRGRNGRVEKYP